MLLSRLELEEEEGEGEEFLRRHRLRIGEREEIGVRTRAGEFGCGDCW